MARPFTKGQSFWDEKGLLGCVDISSFPSYGAKKVDMGGEPLGTIRRRRRRKNKRRTQSPKHGGTFKRRESGFLAATKGSIRPIT